MYKCMWLDNDGVDHVFSAVGWTWNNDKPGPNGKLPNTWKVSEAIRAVVAALKTAGYECDGSSCLTLEVRCQTS